MFRAAAVCSRPMRPLAHQTATRWFAESATTAPEVRKTCLFASHEKHNAKLVNYSGFLMPIQYADMSIVESHLHTRTAASVFDVSHMLQTKIHGGDRVEFIESLTVADVRGLADNGSTLSVFTNYDGGIIDDLIITVRSSPRKRRFVLCAR